MGMQGKVLFALGLHFGRVGDVGQQVDEVWGDVIWELSTSKEQLKPREHNAIAHGKYVG